MSTRRIFLRDSALVLAGIGSVPMWMTRAAALTNDTGSKRRKTLVVIFQRGAADTLSMVAPFTEKRYQDVRPTIAIAPATQARQNFGGLQDGIDLDGRFALHNAMQPVKALWEKKQLGIVVATGQPDSSRSHFDAQDYMESGTSGKTLGDGWLNRALTPPGKETSPLRAVGMGSRVARTLRGERDAVAMGDAQQFNMGNQDAATILENAYAASGDAKWGRTGKNAFEAMKMIQTINQSPYNPQGGAQYAQGGELGRSLQQLARLIKADVGVEAAFAEVGGWDTHSNQNGSLFGLLRAFSTALLSFTQDMGDRMEDIVLVTMSEFGRTVEENGNAGTDHGHGSMMMVLGGAVAGGKVYGKWPGLEKEQLFEGRDLAVTTDYRTVLSELIGGHLGQKDLGPVFPNFPAGRGPGLCKGKKR